MQQTIYLAGGCFWGVQAYFDLLDGALRSQVGYANSHIPNPSYEQVCSGTTNAVEALEFVFDASLLPLETILEHFFSIIDPFAINHQGPDKGTQYRSGIYLVDEDSYQQTQHFIQKLQAKLPKPIATEIQMLTNFYQAEPYHQKYLLSHPDGYCHIPLDRQKLAKKFR